MALNPSDHPPSFRGPSARYHINHDTSAVSELVAVILLVAMLVIGMGVVAVTIFSQPAPEEIPRVDILISNTSTELLLEHHGGTPLRKETTEITFDETAIDLDAVTLRGGDGAWPWTVGEAIVCSCGVQPRNVQVFYTGPGGPAVLRSVFMTGGGTGPGGDVGPGEKPITVTFPDQEALDEWVVDQFVDQFEGRSLYFSRTERGSQGYLQGEMTFDITGSGSYVVIGDDPPTPLSIGDEVRLWFKQGGTPDVMIFALGDRGWTMHAIGDGRGDFELYINGPPDISGNDDLTDCWITGFDNFQSTLTLRVKGGTEHTRLIINNDTYIDEDNGDTFIFSDIRPAEPTLFVLDFPPNVGAGQSVLFVGNASAITDNGVPIYP
ncbi:MAG: type IV pilin N-terminal domain-containing protein [Methanomicrobiales archaeon]